MLHDISHVFYVTLELKLFKTSSFFPIFITYSCASKAMKNYTKTESSQSFNWVINLKCLKWEKHMIYKIRCHKSHKDLMSENNFNDFSFSFLSHEKWRKSSNKHVINIYRDVILHDTLRYDDDVENKKLNFLLFVAFFHSSLKFQLNLFYSFFFYRMK